MYMISPLLEAYLTYQFKTLTGDLEFIIRIIYTSGMKNFTIDTSECKILYFGASLHYSKLIMMHTF